MSKMDDGSMKRDATSASGEMQHLRITGVKSDDIVIFEEKEPRVLLIDALQPIVRVENCVWLKEEKS